MKKQSIRLQWSRTALAVSLAMAAGAAAAVPGYVTSNGDTVPVTDASGNCWRTGDWTPDKAAAPCHAVARAQAAPPPPVVQAPPAPAPTPLAPIVQAPAPVIQRINLSTDVLFEFNKAELRPGAHQKLDELAQTMQGAEVDRVVVIGHADRIASENYNQDLSERRASAVKEYLAGKGVASERVQAEGRGESQPVTQCGKMGPENAKNQKLVSCLQPDRRVEIEVLGHRQVAGDTPAGAGAGTSGSAGGTASGGASSGNPPAGSGAASGSSR